MSGADAVKRFVRGTLGCGCSDEVFAKIELEQEVLQSGEHSIRLVIGDRLLVWAIGSSAEHASHIDLARRIADGIELRDARGLNRFRLVLGVVQPRPVEDALQLSFAKLPLPDDRIHLHVVPVRALEQLLQSAAAPQQ